MNFYTCPKRFSVRKVCKCCEAASLYIKPKISHHVAVITRFLSIIGFFLAFCFDPVLHWKVFFFLSSIKDLSVTILPQPILISNPAIQIFYFQKFPGFIILFLDIILRHYFFWHVISWHVHLTSEWLTVQEALFWSTPLFVQLSWRV